MPNSSRPERTPVSPPAPTLASPTIIASYVPPQTSAEEFFKKTNLQRPFSFLPAQTSPKPLINTVRTALPANIKSICRRCGWWSQRTRKEDKHQVGGDPCPRCQDLAMLGLPAVLCPWKVLPPTHPYGGETLAFYCHFCSMSYCSTILFLADCKHRQHSPLGNGFDVHFTCRFCCHATEPLFP